MGWVNRKRKDGKLEKDGMGKYIKWDGKIDLDEMGKQISMGWVNISKWNG